MFFSQASYSTFERAGSDFAYGAMTAGAICALPRVDTRFEQAVAFGGISFLAEKALLSLSKNLENPFLNSTSGKVLIKSASYIAGALALTLFSKQRDLSSICHLAACVFFVQTSASILRQKLGNWPAIQEKASETFGFLIPIALHGALVSYALQRSLSFSPSIPLPQGALLCASMGISDVILWHARAIFIKLDTDNDTLTGKPDSKLHKLKTSHWTGYSIDLLDRTARIAISMTLGFLASRLFGAHMSFSHSLMITSATIIARRVPRYMNDRPRMTQKRAAFTQLETILITVVAGFALHRFKR